MVNALTAVEQALNQVILGKSSQIRLALCCLLAKGHLLLEDLPGMGKTTLAHALATSLGLQYQRVQFTSDLLPADLTGFSIYDARSQQFNFKAGPVFSQVLLADEINRASPKTQSALLEAMEEQQVSIDGESRSLPTPFFVIATQNPQFHSGTHPLPESQLDRFLMRLSLGFPDRTAELQLLQQQQVTLIQAQLTPADLMAIQQQIPGVHASPALLNYLLDLLAQTRHRSDMQALSPRAGKALLSAAKAYAFLQQRDFVTADDVQAVFAAVAEHRLQPITSSTQAASYSQLILSQTPCRI
jgi:MoxR-like ATPase